MKVKGITWIEVIVGIIIVIAIAFIIGGAVYNESNRISTGVVIDKNYTPSYTTTTYINNFPSVQYHPPHWQLTIEGEKEGEIVQYSFSVDETTYNRYELGSQYP